MQSGLIDSLRALLFAPKCEWKLDNLRDLEIKMNREICGQPLAMRLIFNEIDRHITSQIRGHVSESPLVISIHGTPGSGKTTLVKQLTQQLRVSSYDPQEFYGSSVKLTSLEVASTIIEQLQVCSKRIFIFDEADKLRPEIVNHLVQFIEGSRKSLARDAIFIFVMNIGQDAILKHMSNHIEDAENDRFVGSELYERLAPVYASRKPARKTSALDMIKHANELHKGIFNDLLKYSVSPEELEGDAADFESRWNRGVDLRSFLNEFVTRKLIKHHVAFLHIARDDFRCCIDLALRKRYAADGFPIDPTHPSPYWDREVIDLIIELSSGFEPIYKHELFTKPGCRTANEVITRTIGLLDLKGGETIRVEHKEFVIQPHESRTKDAPKQLAHSVKEEL